MQCSATRSAEKLRTVHKVARRGALLIRDRHKHRASGAAGTGLLAVPGLQRTTLSKIKMMGIKLPE